MEVFSKVTSDRNKRKWPHALPGEIQVGHEGEFLHGKSLRSLPTRSILGFHDPPEPPECPVPSWGWSSSGCAEGRAGSELSVPSHLHRCSPVHIQPIQIPAQTLLRAAFPCSWAPSAPGSMLLWALPPAPGSAGRAGALWRRSCVFILISKKGFKGESSGILGCFIACQQC